MAEQMFCAGPFGRTGDVSESEQALYIAAAPTASNELNKRFFIIFLFHILSKIRFSLNKRHKKKFFKREFVMENKKGRAKAQAFF
jgi:hypothetical protein